jgi:hypothetical protein
MEVFIFVGKGGFCGATKEASGASLPGIGGPWHFLKKTNLSLENGIDAMTALRDIKSKGYHLITSESLSGTLENA